MNRTRITIYLTAVPTLPISVSRVLADEDCAKDIIHRIMDGRGFSQVTAACVYEAEHDDDRSPILDVN
jgi:alkaline phosphatase